MMWLRYGEIMGRARIKGSFDERKKAAIESGRVKVKRTESIKHYYYDPFLGITDHVDEIMALTLATLALGRQGKK